MGGKVLSPTGPPRAQRSFAILLCILVRCCACCDVPGGMEPRLARFAKRVAFCCIVSHPVRRAVAGWPYHYCCASLCMFMHAPAGGLGGAGQAARPICETCCIPLHSVASDPVTPARRPGSDVHPCACLCLLRGLDPLVRHDSPICDKRCILLHSVGWAAAGWPYPF